MVWNSMLFSQNDIFATSSKILQPWRLSPKHYMSMDFVECITAFNLSATLIESKYVVGRVLPIRWPNVKQIETLVGDELQESNELVSFTYGQFIQLDCIKQFTENIVYNIEYGPQILAKGGVKQEWQLPVIKTVHKSHLHKTWDQLCIQDDQSQHLYEVFSKQTVNFQDAFVKPRFTIRECVEYDDSRSQRLKSFWVSNQRMNVVKFLGKDISQYKFDAGQWVLDEHEVLTMTSAYNIVDSNEVEKNQKIVEKLSDDKVTNKLLTILDQIPNLQIKLSPQQQVVVQSSSNLLCLGRSGTGKTTSSVLRLFSQEVMFILLRKQAKLSKKDLPEGQKSIKLQLTSADLMKPCNMKTVFISASPVLVNEVSRFYHKLKDSLISHLKHKETKSVEINAQHQEIMQLAQMEAELIEEELAAKSHQDIPNAFEDLKPKDFPLFVTVKQLLYMFDASLDYSFFARDSKNNLIGMTSNLSWHNENKGLFMINSEHKSQTDFDQLLFKYGQELVDEQEEAIEVLEVAQQEPEGKNYRETWNNRYKTNQEDKTAYYVYKGQQLSFEVDFEVFEIKFFSRFSQHQKFKRLSCSMIWTEIFSVIKGGLNSRDHYQGFLTGRSYVKQHASPFLTQKERQTVYWIFIEYERWKQSVQAFDLMDLVNHVTSSGKANSSYYAHLMRMDYLMVDEVQDLTPTTLQLLLKLTKQQVYFAGDTAQTIAKGVGARFSDLKTQMQLFQTKVIQLTTNYRSHGQILALANSVVSLLEVLFPFSIDALAKEVSETTGMKPLILMPMPAHELRRFFIGSKNESQRITSGLASQKPQFGCNQVVIVREQHQKEQLPDFLQSMLCLTVYEAKGLEFDDVILYNFFNSGEISTGHWKFINEIHFEEGEDGDNQIDQIVQGLENMIVNENAEDIEHVKKRRDLRRMTNKNTFSRSIVYRKFASLCIELKQLYVAITRPKLRLIIYDEDVQSRLPVQRVWEHLKVVDVVTTTLLEQKKLPEDLQQLFQTEHGALGGSESKPEEWKIQGIKFYKKKQFDQAIKCFKYADEPVLMAKCYAYKMADAGNAKIAEADTIVWKLKTLQSSKNNKTERKQLLRDQKVLRVAARKEFDIAGDSFYQCGLKSQAASCYFTAHKLNKAAEIFEELGQFGQAGECLMRSSKVDSSRILRAAEMFERAGLVSRAIECYERIEAWERLLQCLHQSKAAFKQADREQLANKYIPIALNKLYSMMMGGEKVQEANQGVLAEIKIKEKYRQEDAIQEEDEQYFSEEDVEDEEVAQLADSAINEQEILHSQDVDEPKSQNEADTSFDILASDDEDDILEDVFELKKKRSEQVKETSPEHSQEDSFEILEEAPNLLESQSEYEHLSQYDPDDEFLQSQSSFALLNSILQNKTLDQQSEYSIIESDMDIISMDSSIVSTKSRSTRFIKSQRKVADEVIKKIIYYISLFSEEVRGALSKLGKPKQMESEIDLQSTQPEFIDLVLNILEHYDLIKLCLILCNKFKLTSRLGRYIVSSCFKYQSLQQIRFTHCIMALQSDSPHNRKLRQQSMIAHEALHNVFGLVDPTYLILKPHGTVLSDDNSLGIENLRFMFGLGFWKKLVYIMNVQLGIDLCYKFCDLYNFNCLVDKCEQDYSVQRSMLQLRSVAVICARLWSCKVQSIQHFADICQQVQSEVQMNQLESASVTDYLQIVEFSMLPSNVSQKPLLAINLLGQQQHQIDQEAQRLRDEQLWSSTFNQGIKTITKVFGQLDNTDEQMFLAYTLFAFNCNLNELPQQSLTTLKAIYNSVDYDQLYASLNMQKLAGDLFQNYQNYLLVSVHSQIAEDIQKLQKQSLRLSIESEYIQKATQIVRTQFRKTAKVQEIKELRSRLERNHKAVQLQHFCIQEPQQPCAFVIDMDLQFILVPKEWIESIVMDRLSQFKQSLNRVQTTKVLDVLTRNLSPQQLVDVWTPILQHQQSENQLHSTSLLAKLNKAHQQLLTTTKQLDPKVSKLLYPTAFVQMKSASETKPKQQVNLASQLYSLLSEYPVPYTISVPGHARVQSFFTKTESIAAPIFAQTGSLFINQNTLNTSDYLSTSLKLMTICNQLPLFIDEVSQQLKQQQSLEMKHIRIGYRLLAYSQLSQNQQLVQHAIHTHLQANTYLAPYINPLKNVLMLQQSFYALAASLCKQITMPCYMPCYAMAYISPQFDYGLIDTAKQTDSEYNMQKQVTEDDDQYYDEWDRPSIEDVKQSQLVKRPSAQVQETKSLLSHECVLPAIDAVKGQAQMKDVLNRFVDVIADLNVNGSDISTNQIQQVLLESFNVMMTLCCNWSNLSPYRLVLEQFFKQLEQSSMSDHFHQMLFQFTEEASEIKQMFLETDDYLKHSFFAKNCYLVQVKCSYSQQRHGGCQTETYRWLAKRVRARLFIKKQLSKAVEVFRRKKMMRELRPQLNQYSVNKDIYKINQVLPHLPSLLSQARVLDKRLLQLQNYCISSQTQVTCYEIQLLLAKQAAYRQILDELIQALNTFVQNKWQILEEFSDEGNVDSELKDALDRAVTEMEVCDGEIVMWSILSDVKKRLKETDLVRSKRMQIKWRDWEDLSKRKQRLQKRIAKLQQYQ